jgi:hypothetical protein
MVYTNVKIQRGNSKGIQGGGRRKHPENTKGKRTELDVPRHVEGRGEQTKNENGR